jgi:hypothetical protein
MFIPFIDCVHHTKLCHPVDWTDAKSYNTIDKSYSLPWLSTVSRDWKSIFPTFSAIPVVRCITEDQSIKLQEMVLA